MMSADCRDSGMRKARTRSRRPNKSRIAPSPLTELFQLPLSNMGCLFGKYSHSASFRQECESPLY
jgi:hypothetical protein